MRTDATASASSTRRERRVAGGNGRIAQCRYRRCGSDCIRTPGDSIPALSLTLWWILSPVARLVGVMTRTRFAFQPGEGCFSRDRYAVTLALPLANGAASIRWLHGARGRR